VLLALPECNWPDANGILHRTPLCDHDRRTAMALKIERKQPEGMNVRMHGGKPGYSHVVTAD
jgi:hypothetical protein